MGTFRFKKFSVTDDRATMKVGTDAVLLGAWCETGQSKRILDIGTGSGVIALMLAQRTGPDTRIDAVEMNLDDSEQAAYNVEQSPWPDKVRVIHSAIQHFTPDDGYDLIVTNPPYFSNSLLPPDSHRMNARHDARLSRKDLLASVDRLLNRQGTFCVILPATEADSFQIQAKAAGLNLVRHTRFYTRKEKSAERALLSFSREEGVPVLVDQLVLYDSGNTQTDAYRQLTADFYL